MKRPKFEVWAIQSQDGRPPGPLLHLRQTLQVRRGFGNPSLYPRLACASGGQLCSYCCSVWRKIQKGVESMAICRSEAYLRRSLRLCCVRDGVSRAICWASDAPQKSGYLLPSRFRVLCATVHLCLAARYRRYEAYCREREGDRGEIKVNRLRAWRPAGEAASQGASDWCQRSAPFPKRELWSASDASRLITRFVMGLPRVRE